MYEDLIKSLRCVETEERDDDLVCANKWCKYCDPDGACDGFSMDSDAADAIEALEAQLAEKDEAIAYKDRIYTAMGKDMACLTATLNAKIDKLRMIGDLACGFIPDGKYKDMVEAACEFANEIRAICGRPESEGNDE